MESNTSGIRIEKLDYSNFHSWKQKMELILGHREVDEMIDPNLRPRRPTDQEELLKWLRKDKSARMAIGITLSDEMLKNVAHTTTALEMWQEICNVHQRHTLLNKLAARRDFYTATMKPGEQMLVYINRVRQMATVLSAMGVDIDDKEMAMAVLNGLPSSFQTLITALDAIGDEDPTFTFDKVRSLLLQEERRAAILKPGSSSTDTAALFSKSGKQSGNNRKKCTHCGRTNHTEPYCWQKYGRPSRSRSNNKPRTSTNLSLGQGNIGSMAAVATETEPSNEEEKEYVCLLSANSDSAKSVQIASTWYIDSAATSHMTFDRSMFVSYRSVTPFQVILGDKSTSVAVGCGDVKLSLLVNGKARICLLRDVLHVPSFAFSLISVSTLTARGIGVQFTNNTVLLTHNGEAIATGHRRHGLYAVDLYIPSRDKQQPFELAFIASLQLWHERLGHVHKNGISRMAQTSAVKGLRIKTEQSSPENLCEGCVTGKLPRAAIPKFSETRASEILQLIHTDLAGPMEIRSKGGARYFVTFIDDKSRWLTVYLLHRKSDCFDAFQRFLRLAETQTGCKLRQLRSDGGGEYFSNEFSSFLEDRGIQRQTTCAYTPQQNGVAERMNRTLKDHVRAMLLHNSTPSEFWAEALSCAAYIRNRLTSRAIPAGTTPYELWHGWKPNVAHLRTFGSTCWYKLPTKHLQALDSRAAQAIMLGYATSQKAYKLWDLTNEKIVVSRDVVFEETRSKKLPPHLDFPGADVNLDESTADSMRKPTNSDDGLARNESSSSSNSGSDSDHISPQSPPQTPSSSQDASLLNAPRKSSRTRKPPSEWWKTTALLTTAPDPTPEHLLTYTEVTKGEEKDLWIGAIQSEMNSLHVNRTWTLVPRSEAVNLLSSKWVFKRKDVINDNGEHSIKHKARLVTRGFQQKYGIDYAETYAPVVQFCTLRMFFALTVHHDLHCDQMDVKTAFLYGDLEQDIFMEQPEGFVDSKHPDHVCKLQKALYGLKQAPRQWHAKIDDFLISHLGFQSSPYDPCFYIRYRDESMIIIALYVDDILLASSSRDMLDELKAEFSKRFEMKDCGRARVCLGLEILRNPSKGLLHLNQSRYAEKVLERFGMENASPVVTPMQAQISVGDTETEPIDSTLYRKAIGSMMYLAVGTRPDIAFAVGRLAQFVEAPTKALWVAVKRVLRYIAGTRDFGLMYRASATLAPVGYSDSDWGGCTINRKSTSGYVFMMAGGAVSWKSRKQGCVAQSSSEAEYMALSAAVKEAIWLRNIVGFSSSTSPADPILINVDNQGSIKMARNDASGTRTKHIDIRYHFVRDCLLQGMFDIDYCPSSDMVADVLTKPLQRIQFVKLREIMGVTTKSSIEKVKEGEC